MKILYVGRKDSLNMARPELEKKYNIKKGEPCEVTRKDGLYLTQEFPTSFVVVEDEAEKVSDLKKDQKDQKDQK